MISLALGFIIAVIGQWRGWPFWRVTVPVCLLVAIARVFLGIAGVLP